MDWVPAGIHGGDRMLHGADGFAGEEGKDLFRLRQGGNIRDAYVVTDRGAWLDLNRADASELAELPGIGETLAQAILDEREAHGPFHYPEDLIAVRGIGQSRLESIRGWIDLSEGD